MENYIGKKCIVRSYGAGVFFGEVKEVSSDANGLNVRIANVRKVWYWDGAAAVEQLSQDGCNDNSKITGTWRLPSCFWMSPPTLSRRGRLVQWLRKVFAPEFMF